jgi:hypothetical protein
LLDRQGHENDRGSYLESWNGYGSYDYHRIGRGSLLISFPSIVCRCTAEFSPARWPAISVRRSREIRPTGSSRGSR